MPHHHKTTHKKATHKKPVKQHTQAYTEQPHFKPAPPPSLWMLPNTYGPLFIVVVIIPYAFIRAYLYAKKLDQEKAQIERTIRLNDNSAQSLKNFELSAQIFELQAQLYKQQQNLPAVQMENPITLKSLPKTESELKQERLREMIKQDIEGKL